MGRVFHRRLRIFLQGAAALLILAASARANDVNFDDPALQPGDSVVGLGAVHPLLNIQHAGPGPLVVVEEGDANVLAYNAGFDNAIIPNAALHPDPDVVGRGFASPGEGDGDLEFTFAEGYEVGEFSIRMLDYGDLFRQGTTNDMLHVVRLVAYDWEDNVVDEDLLVFTSKGGARTRRMTSFFGEPVDLALSTLAVRSGEVALGDAYFASPGDPGNFTFFVSGKGIVRVVLEFVDTDPDRPGNASMDDGVGFTDIYFAAAEDETPGVQIDVLPGDPKNEFVLDGKGTIPVAIFGAEGFDVRQIDPASLVFGGLELTTFRQQFFYWIGDLNGDGHDDFVGWFRNDPDMWLHPPGDTEALLTGALNDGSEFEAVDNVSVTLAKQTSKGKALGPAVKTTVGKAAGPPAGKPPGPKKR